MLADDISRLICPTCGTPLMLLHGTTMTGGALVEGLAGCDGCQTRYPILHGVLILLHETDAEGILDDEDLRTYRRLLERHTSAAFRASDEAMRSSGNWAEQLARRFPVTQEMLAGEGFWGETSFWTFCGLGRDEVQGRNVCVYCGGSGREAHHLLRAGASKVWVVDIGAHLLRIMQTQRVYASRLVPVLADFRNNPVRPADVDISICDHALQHVEDNAGAFALMTSKTRPGGLVSVCVYSRENNLLMTHVVEPLKPLLHRLGRKGLLALARLPAALLYAAHVTYGFLERIMPGMTKSLPFRELFRLWGRDGFTMFHHACFDLLHAPVSYHFARHELEEMARSNRVHVRTLHMVNRTMWTMVGTTPEV